MDSWKPDSWKGADVRQQPTYGDPAAVDSVAARLAILPPLVTSWEVETLRSQLASAARGERFVLQGGDCAESFAECTSDSITAKLKILLQMSLVLTHSLKKRVIRIGRFAGQYAKPRSSDTETRNGETLPSYRGDLVNSLEFTAEAREPDPINLLRGYQRSALTLNFIRGLIDGGFADLHHPEYWNLDFVDHSQNAAEYQRRVESIADSLRFMETLAGVEVGQIDRVDFYTSHEALHLVYEQAQTRTVPRREGWYNLATHLPWIGLRTAFQGSAHIEYARGIRNPLGVKVGTGMKPADIAHLVDVLNPDGEEGRLALIHRCGTEKVAEELPPILQAVCATGKPVLWICDPMHGNTKSTGEGMKTRAFSAILSELEQAFDIHAANGTVLGGVHFELTGEDVTECVGGARGLDEQGLRRAYRSQVDPRLNYEQALEMALLVARKGAATS
ncbi:MAG: 3-deoxy-7-phosphoheptulonate synthase class II [Acidobacteria bacterium]|nr:3-deoxy-7-phosphoheptulonate synthase class II [Acidobacteriota bacterium]